MTLPSSTEVQPIACPFCGDGNSLGSLGQCIMDPPTVSVHCASCGGVGPLAGCWEDAVSKWNGSRSTVSEIFLAGMEHGQGCLDDVMFTDKDVSDGIEEWKKEGEE